MKNTLKKAISVLLVAVMVFGAAPLAGFVGIELPELNLFGTKAEATGECEHPEDELVWETIVEPTCVPGTEVATCNVCGASGKPLKVACDKSTYPESEHSYSNYTNRIWEFSHDGAKKLVIKFSSSTETESNYDNIYIYDATDTQVGKYSGTQLSGKEIELEGSSFKIKLTSDSSVTAYGFSIDTITAVVNSRETSLRREIPSVAEHNWSTSDDVCENGCGMNGGTCGDNLTWALNSTTGELVISGKGAMRDWTSSSSVSWYSYRSTIKSVTISDGVTSIGDYAFYDCNGITSITIPDSVTSIGINVFNRSNNNLAAIYYTGDLAAWCKIIFDDYSGHPMYYGENLYINGKLLEGDIVIPEGVTSIGNNVFYNCDGLTSVTFPDSVTSIGSRAFYNCDLITSVTFPDSVISIGGSAFYGCNKLSAAYYVGTQEQWEKITIGANNGNLTKNIICECNSERPYRASGVCGTNLSWKLYPDGELVISGTGAMTDWTYYSSSVPWYKYRSSIKSVTIFDGVTSIGGCAFYDYDGLTSVTIPDSVTSIGAGAFAYCDNLANITIPDNVTSVSRYAFSGCSGLTSITIGNSVTSIGEYAFEDCDSLKSVTFGENSRLTTIGEYAFNGCTSLTSITIPDSVTSIGEYAFYNCGLTSVTIGNGVTSIGGSAFSGCTSLASVTIPDSVTSIGGSAFDGTAFYEDSSNWENDVLYIGKHLIEAKSSFSGEYQIKDGAKVIANAAFYGCDSLTSVTIPNSVTSIGISAFNGCTSLASITIPDSVTSIGYRVFYGCSGLTSITIPDSVTSIDDDAFNGCGKLATTYYVGTQEQWKSITIGTDNDNLTKNIVYECNSERPYIASGVCGENLSWKLYSDGELVISGTGAMTDYEYKYYGLSAPWYKYSSSIKSVTISDGVTSIGDYAFDGCYYITSITIPASVTSIGEDALYSCFGLTSITVDSGNTVYSSDENGVLFNKDKTVLIQYPADNTRTSYTIPDSVTSIGEYAFYFCDITSITIPDSVTSIGEYAFNSCDSLENVYYTGDVVGWCSISFNSSTSNPMCYADNLYINGTLIKDNLEISDGVTSIGNYAFYNCNGFTTITIPDSVTSIGYRAFSCCDGLTSATIGNGVTSIGKYAFDDCDNLKSVTFGENSKLTSIGDYMFYNCTSLESITIPDSVTSIGDSAFDGTAFYEDSSNWENDVLYIGNHLIEAKSSVSGEYQIKDGTKVIVGSAFYDCDSLTGVTIPDSVTNIGNSAFKYCDSLENVYYTGNAAGWCAINFNSNISNPMYYADNLYINGVLIKDNLVIPDGVTSIGDYAFYDCDNLTSITIPDSVTSIGDYAFYDCDNLTSITIPDSVTSIGYNAFYDCDNLTSINYLGTYKQWSNVSIGSGNSVLVGKLVFKDDSDLTWVNWGTCGENLTWNLYSNGELIIGGTGAMTDWSYYKSAPWHEYRSSVKSVIILDGVTSIGEYAFNSCTSIESVIIGNSVTSIGDNAFAYCSGLTSVTFGENSRLTSIGEYAFAYCDSLTSIIIPDGVTSIGDSAFYDCEGLTSITIPESVTNFGNFISYYSDSNNNLADVYYTGDLAAWCKIVFDGYYGHPMRYAENLYINGKLLEGDIVIPQGVTGIGDYAFYNCSGLTSVTISDSVTSIGKHAFSGCDGLTSVTIHESVTSIDENAFYGCSNLINAYYTGDVAGWCETEFKNSSSNPATYAENLYINGTLIKGKYVIPDGVTSIGNYAFYNCDFLLSVTIPDSVTSIGDSAFYDCEILVSVTFPESLTSIGKSVFYSCPDLEKAYYPATYEKWQNISGSSDNEELEGVLVFESNSKKPYYGGVCGENLVWRMYVDDTELTISGTGDMTDYSGWLSSTAPWSKQSSKIKSVTIADGVTSIGSYAFLNLKSLTTARVSDSVTSIGNYAFAGCNILANINLPDSLITIGDRAFWYCYGITKVTIPNGTTSIGEYAFSGCILISSVTIPASVTYIGKYAFEDCTYIRNVYYGGSKAEWEEIIICSGNENLTSAWIHYNSMGSDGGSTDEPDVPDNTPAYDSSVIDTSLMPTPSETTISYGDSIVLHMDPAKIPEGGKVEWYPSNGNFSYSVSADGTTCTITPEKSGNTTFTAIVYDAEGNIVSADKQEMTSKAGFFDKIIAFFKKLFGATKVIPQAFKGIY